MGIPGIRFRAAKAIAIALFVPALLAGLPAQGGRAASVGLRRVLAHMDEAARHVKTVSTRLTYTSVTVLVNYHSTEYGELFFRKGRRLEVMVKFLKPTPKEILFKRNRAEIYSPSINQLEEYSLARHRQLLQEFLLLGFGTRVRDLESSYHIKYLGEQRLGNQTTQLLGLVPIQKDVAAQLTHVNLWVSEATWLPVQQKFYEPGGDYLVARYSGTVVNRRLRPSIFKIRTKPGAERMKMN